MSLPRSNDMVRARQRLRRLLATIDDLELAAEIERVLERIDVIDRRDDQTDKLRARTSITAGQQTINGCVYPRETLEHAVVRFREQIDRRRAFGTFVERARDGRTRLEDASHLVSAVNIDENGNLDAEIEVLATPQGRVLRELLDAEVPLRLSARGFGSVRADGQVEEDYRLQSIDVLPAHDRRIPPGDTMPLRVSAIRETERTATGGVEGVTRFLRSDPTSAEDVEDSDDE